MANGRLLAALAKNGESLSRSYADDRVSVHCRMPRKFLGQLPPEEARIKLRSNGQDFVRNGEANGNGHAESNGHAHTNGHSTTNGHSNSNGGSRGDIHI